MSDPAFNQYALPPKDATFSVAYFGALRFVDLPNLALLESLRSGALIHFDFYPSVPDSVTSTTLNAGEWVPAPEDLRPVFDSLPAAFARGSRSVVLKVKRSPSAKPEVRLCHFQKARFFSYP